MRRWEIIDPWGHGLDAAIVTGRTLRSAVSKTGMGKQAGRNIKIWPFNGSTQVLQVQGEWFNRKKFIYPKCMKHGVGTCPGHTIGREMIFTVLAIELK